MQKKIVCLCVYLISLLLSAIAYADNCNGVIRNHSNQPWKFNFSAYDGNVYFSGVPCPVNGPCIIPPHTDVGIEYTHTGGYVTGRVYIQDTQRWEEKFEYGGVLWVRCPHVRHNGSTGSISLNEPSNGSFQINSDSWREHNYARRTNRASF